MKQSRIPLLASSILSICALLLSPLAATADGPPLPPEVPLIITEVRTGNAARADEFVELYNTTDQPLDISGWQLRYVTSSATSLKTVEDPSTTITLAPQLGGTPTALAAHGYAVLYAGATVVPDGIPSQQYTDILPATGGSLVLVQADSQTCMFAAIDALAWGSTVHLFGLGTALTASSSSSKDRVFTRYVQADGNYANTSVNAADFASLDVASAATSVGQPNTLALPVSPSASSGAPSQVFTGAFANPNCTPPVVVPPIDPSTPPVPDPVPPTDPQPDPDPTPPGPVDPQPGASDGVDPVADTPPADDPVVQPTTPNSGLNAPLITELLPDPAPPQSDDADEYVELYNPNDVSFDLSGYVLEAGIAAKHQLIFAAGATLAPHAYAALFSADTGLTLTNSGGQVRLFDPSGQLLTQTDEYSAAKESQAWALVNGVWQWTTLPTPNAQNASSPAVIAKVASATTKAKKATVARAKTPKAKAIKAVKPKSVKPVKQVSAMNTGVQNLSAVQPRSPLHPAVLALIAASALLYGVYEYRRDVANKFYQFRSNRAARAAARRGPEGR